MKKEERKAIKEILKLSIKDYRYDSIVLQILKKADSKELLEIFYDAYLEVVKKEGNEKQSELQQGKSR